MPSIPASLATRLESAAGAFAAHLDDLIHEYGPDNVKAAMRAYYAKYVAPLDVPYVPDALEPMVIDTPAMLAIDGLFDFFHSKIHRDSPAPASPPTT